MGRIIDKIIILSLIVFAMYSMMHGNSFLVCFYTSIIIGALNYYLIEQKKDDFRMKPKSFKEWTAFIIEILAAALAFFYPPAIPIIPMVMYDIVTSRNYIAFVLSIVSFVNALEGLKAGYENYVTIILYLLAVTLVSIVLSIKTERLKILSLDYRKLRDDDAEQSEKLKRQNNELMYARDTVVYNAQLSERNRIAREIHDNVGHMLSRAILQMGALLAIHKDEPLNSELTEVRKTLDLAMNNIRSSVHDLHDESIDIKAEILQMAEPLKDNFHIKVDIDIDSDMPRQIKYAVIGIAKEGISNIIKHSKSSTVDIKLDKHPSMYQLIIHDYTPGKTDINPEETDKDNIENEDSGIGLENIRSRVESVNGSLNISRKNGFRVFVTIPDERKK
ncbi:MAG: sensor histidine kinase [Eubacterium sp.]|nr:sensor histidine kinase [Eubacterium sp.]